MLLYTMKNRRHKLASYSHTFYSQSAEGVALLYSASSYEKVGFITRRCASISRFRERAIASGSLSI